MPKMSSQSCGASGQRAENFPAFLILCGSAGAVDNPDCLNHFKIKMQRFGCEECWGHLMKTYDGVKKDIECR